MYRLKIKKRTSLCILFLGMVIAVSAQGNKGDSLLTTLKNELKYNMEALQKQKKAPYFMSLRLQDSKTIVVESNLGNATTMNQTRQLRT